MPALVQFLVIVRSSRSCSCSCDSEGESGSEGEESLLAENSKTGAQARNSYVTKSKGENESESSQLDCKAISFFDLPVPGLVGWPSNQRDASFAAWKRQADH